MNVNESLTNQSDASLQNLSNYTKILYGYTLLLLILHGTLKSSKWVIGWMKNCYFSNYRQVNSGSSKSILLFPMLVGRWKYPLLCKMTEMIVVKHRVFIPQNDWVSQSNYFIALTMFRMCKTPLFLYISLAIKLSFRDVRE